MNNKKNTTHSMRKWSFLLTCFLCVFLLVGCGQKEKTIKFTTYVDNDVVFYYPKDWNMKVFDIGVGAHIILVSEQKVAEFSDTYRVGLGVLLMPANSRFPTTSKEDIIKSIKKFIKEQHDFLKLKNKEISKEEETVINNMPGLIQKISGEGPGYQKKYYKRSIVTAVTMNSDTIISIAGEAPYDRFDEYKPIFDIIIKSVMAHDVVLD